MFYKKERERENASELWQLDLYYISEYGDYSLDIASIELSNATNLIELFSLISFVLYQHLFNYVKSASF